MRSLITITILSLLFSGCSNISAKVPVQMPDKSIEFVQLGYIRWLNQNISGFYLQSPEGWIISFDKQKSETELAFDAGVASVDIGGSGE